MLNLYETYANDEERQNDAFLESAEIAMDRALLAVETCDAMSEIAMREAELQCMMESGDAETLMGYYEAAEEKADAKKEGLIKRAWKKICDFFKTIKEKLFGGTDKIDPKADYEVNKSDVEDAQKLNKAWASLKNFSKHPIKSSLQIVATVAGILGGVAILAFGAKKASQVIKIKGKTLQDIFKGLKKTTDEMEKDAEGKAQNPKKAGDSESDGKLRSLFSDIGKGIRAVKSSLSRNARRGAAHLSKKGRAGLTAGKEVESEVINQGVKLRKDGQVDWEAMQNENESVDDSEEIFGTDFFAEDASSFDELLDAEEFQESAEDSEVAELLALL